jgi:trans-aconitate 2-methyltransferase
VTGRPGRWDPAQYLRFAGPRRRAALDLLARVDLDDPALVHDLGCGTGDLARVMAERWPAATVIGSDASPEMLEKAKAVPSSVEWRRLDIATWEPGTAPDLIYSNAVLHWLPDHGSLFPRLAAALAPGGVLAVQMPLSWDEPSHRLMRRVLDGAGGPPLGSEELRRRMATPPVADPEWYHDLLRPVVTDLDVWVTRYLHVLEGPDAVLEWVHGSAVRPVVEDLDGADREHFLEDYTAALRLAYPRREDGTTLFWFPRLFLVARR